MSINVIEMKAAQRSVNKYAINIFKQLEEAMDGKSLSEILHDLEDTPIPVYESKDGKVYQVGIVDMCDALWQSVLLKHGEAVRKILRDTIAYAYEHDYIKEVTEEA